MTARPIRRYPRCSWRVPFLYVAPNLTTSVLPPDLTPPKARTPKDPSSHKMHKRHKIMRFAQSLLSEHCAACASCGQPVLVFLPLLLPGRYAGQELFELGDERRLVRPCERAGCEFREPLPVESLPRLLFVARVDGEEERPVGLGRPPCRPARRPSSGCDPAHTSPWRPAPGAASWSPSPGRR